MMPGKFITLEGGEGAGKSTNLAFIQHYLQARRIPLLVTREPGGTPAAERLRQLLLESADETWTGEAELLLMFAARSQHLKNVIQPALAAGQWVLCDRFTDATYAYQGGGRGMSWEAIACLEALVQGSLRPDLTLLLDVPVAVGMQRIVARGQVDRFESERLDFFHKVREAYLEQARRYSGRFRIIDANRPLPQVQQAVADVLAAFLADVRA